MSFDILMKQVSAIASVSGHMGGQVTQAISRASIGELHSPILGAQMMMGDALRLLALIQDLPSVSGYDFEMALGEAAYSNTVSWTSIWQSKERLKDEVSMLKEVTAGIGEALDVLRYEIAQLYMVKEQLASLQSMIGTEATALNQARDLLDREVLPALYEFRDTLEALMRTYKQELFNREFYLWHIDTVFKFVLPPPKGSTIHKRKQEGKKGGEEEEEEEGEEEQIPEEPVEG